MRLIYRYSFLIVLILISCTDQPEVSFSSPTVPITPTANANPTATIQAGDTPLTQTLVIWVPDTLAPTDNRNVWELLEEQVREFEAAQGNVQVELRRKRAQDVGGILPTLRSASIVAPGALPDLTLLTREDLLVAAQGNLIQPLEGWVASEIIMGIDDKALDLGFYDNQLYGLAYILDTLIVAHNASIQTPDIWTFQNFLKSGMTFAFPGGGGSGV